MHNFGVKSSLLNARDHDEDMREDLKSKELFLDFIKMFESRLSAKEPLRGALGSNFENHLVKRANEIRFP